MINFVMIAFCVCAGMVFKKYKLIAAGAHKGINTWILSIALPAVSFKYLPKIVWSTNMFFPILSVVVVWGGAWLCMELYCRAKNYRQRSRSSLEIASGFSNTSFIGFPLIAAYYGEHQLGIATVCDQAMFILLSSAGIIGAVKASKGGDAAISPRFIATRLLRFPPFIGCVLALVLPAFIDFSFAEPFFDKLVATVGPLALFTVGLQLNFTGWHQLMPQVSVAMLYKLILAPALVLAVALLVGIRGDVARISIFEAAMPTLITASVIAEKYQLNAKLVNLVIGLSIVAGLVTTAVWTTVLAAVGI